MLETESIARAGAGSRELNECKLPHRSPELLSQKHAFRVDKYQKCHNQLCVTSYLA